MRNYEKTTIAFFITVTGVIIALIAWMAPFSPIGRSPFAPRATPTPLFAGCKPVLLTEEFDNPTGDFDYYAPPVQKTVVNGRLRFKLDAAENGISHNLDGQYEQYILSFSVYPVGDIFDASINVLVLENPGGFYELRVRPRTHQWEAFKVIRQPDQSEQNQWYAYWTESQAVDLGGEETRIQVEIRRGHYALYVNDQQVFTIEDPDPYLRGTVRIGVGSGETAPVEIEIDHIRICGIQ